MTSGITSGQVKGVNLLATGVTEIIPPYVLGDPSEDVLFLPIFAYAVLRSKTGGAVTTTAQIRIGGNANHDDVMPLFTIPAGAAVDSFTMPALVAQPFKPASLRGSAVSFDVSRAAIGPSAYTGDILVVGVLVVG